MTRYTLRKGVNVGWGNKGGRRGREGGRERNVIAFGMLRSINELKSYITRTKLYI